MTVVFPCHAGDVLDLHRLLKWIAQLDPRIASPALIVADAATPWASIYHAKELALKCFSSVRLASTDQPVKGWIPGSNALWLRAAQECTDQCWLWVETDAVPIKPRWIDALHDAYIGCGKPFMGALIEHQQPGFPSPYMEGCAVYPPNALKLLGPGIGTEKSWTETTASVVVPLAVNTQLIHHLWGQAHNSPTFAERNQPGTNVFCLQQIRPEAVLFHRNKDGSLIRLLRQRNGLFTEQLLIVLSVCDRDVSLAAELFTWLSQLHGQVNHPMLLSFQSGTSHLNRILELAHKVFSAVHTTQYDAPPAGLWAPSCAFRHAALDAEKYRLPWLWIEADLVPLRANWIDTLLAEYQRFGKPFMGPIVAGMGHVNGTAIYPADAPSRMPRALQMLTTAWDMVAKEEMAPFTHDAGHLMCHAWVMRNGRCYPHGPGQLPTFPTCDSVRANIPASAVTFHRVKDTSLIQRLREGCQ